MTFNHQDSDSFFFSFSFFIFINYNIDVIEQETPNNMSNNYTEQEW